jgi:serine protease Do
VVAGADKISITFYDGTIVSGEVVGTDPDSDLAVVKVDVPADRLQPVQVADSTQLKVGQLAVAIGNPFALEGTMTVGFVSALGRLLPVESQDGQGPGYSIPDVIQTDAPINPGNSGGVLVDDQGHVIGVTSAIISPVGASAGIGFAIPSAIVGKVVPVLINTGHYEHSWLGVSGTSLSPDLADAMKLKSDQRGALVVDVVPGSPADKAGLHGSDHQVQIDGQDVRVGGDVITAIDGQSVKEFDDVVTYLVRATEVGQKVNLTVLRNGKEETIQVTLAARPKSEAQQQAQAEPGQTSGAWLGIAGQTVTPEIAQAMDLPEDQQGVLVEQVEAGSPADQAGLRGSYKPTTINGQRLSIGGDVITALDDQPVNQIEDLQGLIRQAEPDQKVTLTVLRDGKQLEVPVTLAERPSNTQ